MWFRIGTPTLAVDKPLPVNSQGGRLAVDSFRVFPTKHRPSPPPKYVIVLPVTDRWRGWAEGGWWAAVGGFSPSREGGLTSCREGGGPGPGQIPTGQACIYIYVCIYMKGLSSSIHIYVECRCSCSEVCAPIAVCPGPLMTVQI